MSKHAAPVSVRLARGSDAWRVAELLTQLGYPTTAQAVAGRLVALADDPCHAVFVAESNDDVCGLIHVGLHRSLLAEREAEIEALVVDAAARGVGVGRALVEQAEQWAREQGCAAMGVRSRSERSGAHAFYTALGYVLIKTQLRFTRSLDL